jgi:hypothetical protein
MKQPLNTSIYGLVALLLTMVTVNLVQALNPRFHTYPEMIAEIDSLLGIYGVDSLNIMIVDTIGITQQDSIPIIAVKISDNPGIDEDEPAVLYIGQVHAEEILGNEIVMQLMNDILSSYGTTQGTAWVNNIQIWMVPTANPEGLSVVMAGLDVTYRKNKRDNIGDGIFRYVPGRGGDSSGVDLNRNFDLNWDRGDTLFQPGAYELYDYYRGPGPFSEDETKALRDLSNQIKPVFSVIYHSSRTGNVSEHVIYPWGWEDAKFPPDSSVITYEATRIATMIPRFGGSGHYTPSYHSARDGTAGDWYYQALGTIQFWIEVGTSDIQPDSTSDIEEIINSNLPAAKFLLNRTIRYTSEPQQGMVYGHVTDAVSGQPLLAEVRILQAYSRLLSPRLTNPQFGNYYRPLLAGTYTMRFLKEGYQTRDTTLICNEYPRQLNIALQPLPMYTISGTIKEFSTGNLLPGTVYIVGEFSDTLQAPSGTFSIQKPQGNYTVLVASDLTHLPWYGNISLSNNLTRDFCLADSVQTVLSDGFESGMNNWTSGGTHNNWGTVTPGFSSGSAVSESPNGEYANNQDSWLQTTQPMDFSTFLSAAVTFWHKYDFEVGYDSAFVEISTNQGTNWQQVSPTYTRMNQDWCQEWLSLNSFAGSSSVLLRFHVRTDSTLAEDGWTMDNVTVIGSQNITKVGTIEKPIPLTYKLNPPYPNPFNSSVVIPYQIAHPGEVTINIVNVLGQQVFHWQRTHSEAGNYKMIWSGTGEGSMHSIVSSGIYFVSFQAGSFHKTQKIVLLK